MRWKTRSRSKAGENNKYKRDFPHTAHSNMLSRILSSRTSAHNSAINAFKMLSRIQGEQSAEWVEKIDFDDRKHVGDMICYITLFCGLDSR